LYNSWQSTYSIRIEIKLSLYGTALMLFKRHIAALFSLIAGRIAIVAWFRNSNKAFNNNIVQTKSP
jgi:hypothetical protein